MASSSYDSNETSSDSKGFTTLGQLMLLPINSSSTYIIKTRATLFVLYLSGKPSPNVACPLKPHQDLSGPRVGAVAACGRGDGSRRRPTTSDVPRAPTETRRPKRGPNARIAGLARPRRRGSIGESSISDSENYVSPSRYF